MIFKNLNYSKLYIQHYTQTEASLFIISSFFFMITRMTVCTWHVIPITRLAARVKNTTDSIRITIVVNWRPVEGSDCSLTHTLDVILGRTLFFYGSPLFFWHMLARSPSCRGSPATFPPEDLKWSRKIIRLVKPLVNMIKTSDRASWRLLLFHKNKLFACRVCLSHSKNN